MKFYATPNWGAKLDSDITEEDLLDSRPEALSRSQLRQLEIDPPNWALKAVTKIGGHRHPKREITYGADVPRGIVPFVGSYDEYTPGEGPKALWDKALSRRRRRQNMAAQKSIKDIVPPGNLSNDEYRFWKGYAIKDHFPSVAQCRWCQTYVTGRPEMRGHHNTTACRELLLALYRFSKRPGSERRCLACNNRTPSLSWGLPLCSSVGCLGKWKFTVVSGLDGLQNAKKLAATEHLRNPAEGPYAGLNYYLAG